MERCDDSGFNSATLAAAERPHFLVGGQTSAPVHSALPAGKMMAIPVTSVTDIQMFREVVWHVIHRLYLATQFATDCECDRAEFGVGLVDLYQMGLRHEELRWLMKKELVVHRKFETQQSPNTSGQQTLEQSCFVLSDLGVGLFQRELEKEQVQVFSVMSSALSTESFRDGKEQEAPTPVWDTERNELKLAGRVVKKFKWRAANQEAILAAFQEDGWPAHIDDPLPQEPEIDPKRRLADAIKSLNRHQRLPMLRFCGDGTGEGVLWEFKQ